MKGLRLKMLVLLAAGLLSACSGDGEMGGFQKNVPDPDFILFDMFKSEPALDEIWDVLDQGELNRRLAEMIKANREDFIVFSHINRDIMEDAHILPDMMKDLRNTVGLIRTTESRFMDTRGQGSFYDKTPSEYRRVMYALSDRLRRDSSDRGLTGSILSMARSFTRYMTDTKSPEKLQADMSDLVKSINEFERDDFLLLTENLGKVLAAASYPMWIKNPEFSTTGDGKFGVIETDYSVMTGYADSGLGNGVKGIHSLLTGLRDRAGSEISDRELIYDLIKDVRGTFLDESNAPVIKDFIYTLEKYFTAGGSAYGTALNTSNADISINIYNTNSANLYSDAEIGNTLKETLGAMMGMFLRDDRCGALTADRNSKSYLLERLSRRLRETGIDWKNAKLEESLYDILVVDPYGRDRTQATGFDGRKPYAISFLEDFFFLGGITNNFGWRDGGSKTEVSGADVCNEHTHGGPANFLTLNDALFSMTTEKFMGKGTYDLAIENDQRRDHLFRSCRQFTNAERNNFRFYYDQNYGALDFVTGNGTGDLGLPGLVYNGGNLNGVSGNPVLNSYRPYNGNGIDEKGLAPWVLGWVARACFEGEGPYYYKNPDAETVTINGETYYVYMRPNGSVYAYVHYNGAVPEKYLYPAEGNDPVDRNLLNQGSPQRENRYKSSWQSDYYMITNEDGTKRYTPGNMDGNAAGPGSLTYNELIPEFDSVRECSSQEEAIFRNYQWVMTEKKFVIIIPMWIEGQVLGLTVESAVYMIIEGNGFAGVCPARKFRGNRVWAKANTDGVSNIPGDYRLDVRVKAIRSALGIVGVDGSMIYDTILGDGPATYSVAFHAMAPLYRLGFPRSPLLNQSAYAGSNMNFEHYQLGSRQFIVGDEKWEKRNMILPILGALLNVLHESATPESKTIANFTDGTLPLLKPLFFYNRNINNYGVCTDSFLPRINGDTATNSYRYPHSKSLIPEQYISGFSNNTSDPSAWFGGWSVRNYYMAAPVTTLFSSLIDRIGIDQNNPDSNRAWRAKGILPLLTQYNMNQPRSDNNRSKTRIISNFVDQLVKLSDGNFNDRQGISYTSADFDNNQYVNWGARRRIFYGLEQLVSLCKVAKTPYIEILQQRSKGTDAAKGGTATKMQRIPEWIFQQRDVDIDMNSIIFRVVGFNDPDGIMGPLKGKGLAAYPDDKPDYTYWTGFDKTRKDLADLTDNLFMKNSRYNITDDMLDLADTLLAKDISDEEVSSLIYTSGKIFAWHNGSRWIWQGEELWDNINNPDEDFASIWRLTKNYIPAIHQKISPDDNNNAGGENYMAMLKVVSRMLKENGVVDCIMDVTLSADSEQLADDIYEFLGEDFVTGRGAMWMTLADLMDDLSENVENTSTETVSDILSGYGFQQNDY